MGEEKEFFERYTSFPSVLDGKGGKAQLSAKKINSTTLMYSAGILVGLLALIAFAYYIVFPYSGAANNYGNTVEAKQPNYVFDYSLSFDGESFDEGRAELDSSEDLKAETGLALSKEITDRLANLAEGESLTLTLAPEEAFGEYGEGKIEKVNRTEKLLRRAEVNRTFVLSLSDFSDQFGDQPVEGKNYSLEGLPWTYSVSSVDESSVTVSQDINEGQIIPVSDLFFIVVSEVSSSKIVTMLSAEDQTLEVPGGNLTIVSGPEYISLTLTPPVGIKIPLGENQELSKVIKFDEESIYLDANHDYAGKEVVLKVTRVK